MHFDSRKFLTSEIILGIAAGIILIFSVVYNLDLKSTKQNETQIKIDEPKTSESNQVQTQELIKIDQGTSSQKTSDIKNLYNYLQVTDSCGANYDSACLKARSGPGTKYPVIMQLRKGIILEIDKTIENESGTWYKIRLNKNILYPERIKEEFYVSGEYVRTFQNEGDLDLSQDTPESQKKIYVRVNSQKLEAYDGETLFMETVISTGLTDTPTPKGEFKIFKKTPSRYMQGPLPGISDQYYDLPGVPWVMYFTNEGAAIHGTYWHNGFGRKWSHGCINLTLDDSEKLYNWAELGTKVIVSN